MSINGDCAGVSAREEPFSDNMWYKNALTAAINFPDLAGFPGGEDLRDAADNNMGLAQVYFHLFFQDQFAFKLVRYFTEPVPPDTLS